jgi:hypothetical protein
MESDQVLIVASGVVCFVCCCILTVKHAKPMALKIVALILSAMMVIPIGFFSLLVVFFPIGQNTVVQTVESPNATYRAEVLDIDQGALGGDTVVDVYETNKHYKLFLFTISKKPQRVYIGNWGEFKSMRIRWEDEHYLVINSRKYHIE